VVDDEPAILRITGAALRRQGYRVLSVTGGAEAVEAYRRHRDEVRAVLLDIMMPEVDGPATLRALLGIDPGVRVIASSGLRPQGPAAPELAAARAFLEKPYSRHELLRTLAEVLRQP
jgi:CheY-like chemotaxis protein